MKNSSLNAGLGTSVGSSVSQAVTRSSYPSQSAAERRANKPQGHAVQDQHSGNKVRNLYHLSQLAFYAKSVTGLPWGRSPAAVIMSMQARCVLNYIEQGLYVYEPKKKATRLRFSLRMPKRKLLTFSPPPFTRISWGTKHGGRSAMFFGYIQIGSEWFAYMPGSVLVPKEIIKPAESYV